MTERLYRTQVLLEPAQHRELAELAHQTGQSISNVVREAVARYLQEEAEKAGQGQEFFQELRAYRAGILARREGEPVAVDVTALIDEMRQEREEEVLRNAFDRG